MGFDRWDDAPPKVSDNDKMVWMQVASVGRSVVEYWK